MIVYMTVVFIRVMIIYFTVLVFLRIMGKRQLGEMQPYEVVITLIIADLATLPMSDSNIPLFNGILPLAILVMVHFGITFLSRKFLWVRNLISGRPVVLISPNGVETQALKDLNMNLDDLLEMLRCCNYYSFDQIQYAIIETNGKMSVIPNSKNTPLTIQDTEIHKSEPVLPTVIVSHGKIVKDKLIEQNLNLDKLSKLLKCLNIKKVKDLIVLSIDENNKIYYQLKGKKYQIIENFKFS